MAMTNIEETGRELHGPCFFIESVNIRQDVQYMLTNYDKVYEQHPWLKE